MEEPEHAPQAADEMPDTDTLEYIRQIFQLVRTGDAGRRY
jgi:hypothetical protein